MKYCELEVPKSLIMTKNRHSSTCIQSICFYWVHDISRIILYIIDPRARSNASLLIWLVLECFSEVNQNTECICMHDSQWGYFIFSQPIRTPKTVLCFMWTTRWTFWIRIYYYDLLCIRIVSTKCMQVMFISNRNWHRLTDWLLNHRVIRSD